MKLCVIVDGYSTGSQYAPLFNQTGYHCIHIQSSSSLPDIITREMIKQDYIYYFTHHDINSTIKNIRKTGAPEFIIAGSDTGTQLADELSDEFNLKFRNLFEKSAARHDKFLMNEAVRAFGLNAAKQLKTNKLEKIHEWMNKNSINFPIVIKPLKSGSGEGFYFCRSQLEINNAFNKLMGSLDLFNQLNEYVFAQEFLSGKEYVVNTVSHNGKHLIV